MGQSVTMDPVTLEKAPNMLFSILIAISLLLLLALGAAALFLAGESQESASADPMDEEKDDFTS